MKFFRRKNRIRRALFLHVQKTAGTSLTEIARRLYGNDNVCSHADYLALGQQGCDRLDFVSGHFGYAFARPLMHGRFCFTFLRDPIDRLLSLYSFYLVRPDIIPSNLPRQRPLDLDGFLELADDPVAAPVIRNTIVWLLTCGFTPIDVLDKLDRVVMPDDPDILEIAKTNLATLDFVGFQENFSADASQVLREIGAVAPTDLRANVSPSRVDRSGLSSATLDRLHELTDQDRALYDHVRANFDRGRPRAGAVKRWRDARTEARARWDARLGGA